MTKEADLYCDAMQAVNNGTYLEVCLCKLLKYKKALFKIPDGMDNTINSCKELERNKENLNKQIKLKKEQYWANTKPLLYIIAGGVIVGIILFSFFGRTNIYMPPNIQQPQFHQQSKSNNGAAPSNNQNTKIPSQLHKKSK